MSKRKTSQAAPRAAKPSAPPATPAAPAPPADAQEGAKAEGAATLNKAEGAAPDNKGDGSEATQALTGASTVSRKASEASERVKTYDVLKDHEGDGPDGGATRYSPTGPHKTRKLAPADADHLVRANILKG